MLYIDKGLKPLTLALIKLAHHSLKHNTLGNESVNQTRYSDIFFEDGKKVKVKSMVK